MATKKPVKLSDRKKKEPAPQKLMDNQDTVAKGDSTATRTRRVTFSTTAEVYNALDAAAWEQHLSKSQLIEKAVATYLELQI